MTEHTVLGIHSYTDPNTQGSFDQFVDGHAWLTVTRGQQTKHYGLWPDNHRLTVDNGPGTDIRTALETRFTPSASRYYRLDPEQERVLERLLDENVTWSHTNTCASWASTTVTKVTGQTLDAGEMFFTDTPRELIESIRDAERRQPTSPANPQAPDAPRQEDSSSSSLSGRSKALHQQALDGVHALDATMNRQPDAFSERMAAQLALLARSEGLDRIDHVVLGQPVGTAPTTRNVFAIQGDVNDPAHRRAQMDVNVAVQSPVEESLQKLQQLDNRLTAQQTSPETNPQLEVAQQRSRS